MTVESWKLIDLLNTAGDYLSKKEIEHPRRNAEALLGKALSLPRIELYLQYDRPLKPPEIREFRDLIRRRVAREPLQQILGEQDFFSCRIRVTKGLLVPRLETEQLVQLICDEAKRRYNNTDELKILDIGCGTGCITVALARCLKNAQVDAVDIDSNAVDATLENARLNAVEERTRVLRGDILEDSLFEQLNGLYHVVVSNPPYVRASDFAALAPEIRNFENPRALIGGEDGLEYYRRLSKILPRVLAQDGFAAFEMGIGQAADVQLIMETTARPCRIECDLSGIERFCIVGTAG